MAFPKTVDHNLCVTIPVALMHPMSLLLTLALRALFISTPDRNVSKGIHLPKQEHHCVHDEWKEESRDK